MKKIKIFLEAVIVIAVVLALILPTTAVITNNEEKNPGSKLQFEDAEEIPLELNYIEKTIGATGLQSNVLLSQDSPEEDIQPDITVDGNNNVIVTYNHKLSVLEAYPLVLYSEDNGDTWQGYELTGFEGLCSYPQIAYMPGSDIYAESEFNGIWFDTLELSTESGYFFYGPDITDDETWEVYGWQEGSRAGASYNNVEDNMWYIEVSFDQAPGPIIGMIDDEQGMEQGIMVYWLAMPELAYVSNWDSGTGPLGMYFPAFDIDQAPVHNNDNVQTEEDYFYITAHDAHEEFNAVQYRRCIPNVEDDIEFVEEQAYLDGGDSYDAQNPVIEANGDQVIVVYMANENGDWDIRCKYSTDRGANWDTSEVASESGLDEQYPAATFVGNNLYVAYVKDGNLYMKVSEDGGATWGEEIQKNEEDGTVVAQENFVDIHKGGLVWVDERNGNFDIYYASLAAGPTPDLVIESISGGLGVSANIKNQGNAEATDVDWAITLDGTVFLGGESSGNIASIAPDESVTIKSGFPLGFGDINIAINAESAEGATASASATAKLLLFFVTGI